MRNNKKKELWQISDLNIADARVERVGQQEVEIFTEPKM